MTSNRRFDPRIIIVGVAGGFVGGFFGVGGGIVLVPLILWVLQTEGGNKTRAAEVLGIDPSTLYRKLNRYGIDE